MSESPSGECPDCGGEYQRLRQRWAMSDCESQSRSKKEYVCANCSETFQDYPTRRETRGRETFYCSKECKHQHESTGETRPCSYCGADVYVPVCHQQEGSNGYEIRNHFCDKECEQEWKRANWVRENHPNWQGGSGGINAVRQAFAEHSWNDTARRYREQHDGGCEVCGGSTERRKLDIHHIIPLAVGGTNDDWNLMAVCHSCHRRAESFIREYTTPHIYRSAENA